MKNARIIYRSGGFHLTQISDEHTPESLAQRMTGGGFVICHDSRWGKERTLIINLSDVQVIELSDIEKDNK